MAYEEVTGGGDHYTDPPSDPIHHDVAASVIAEFLNEQTVSSRISKAWDEQYGFDQRTCDTLHDVGKFFIPLADDGRISDDFSRLGAFLSGVTLALETIDRLCVGHGLELKDFREEWHAKGLVRVVDVSRIEDSSHAEKYEAQSIAIMAKGHQYLTLTEFEAYAQMIDRIDENYPETALHSNVFKAAFGYILGEASRYLPTVKSNGGEIDIEAEMQRLLGDGSWSDDLTELCYETVESGAMIDVSIELNRIQKLFEDLIDQLQITELDVHTASMITNKISQELSNDGSFDHLAIPEGANVTIKNAIYMVLFDVKDVNDGPRTGAELEALDDGMVIEGQFGNVASVTAHPPAAMDPEEWVVDQRMVYGPAIVLKNPICKNADGTITAIHDGKAVLISLDHPALKTSYTVD